jgi:tetratricopeptide (TPR) repeat protein
MAALRVFRLGCCLTLAIEASLTGSLAGQATDSYADAVRLYQAGNVNEAVRQLTTLSDRTVWDEANRAWKPPPFDVEEWLPRAQAAALLHSEVWITRGGDGLGGNPSVHFDAAKAIIRTIGRLSNDRDQTRGDSQFVRDWYLLIAAYLHGRSAVGWSRPLLAEARKLFPRDALLLVASGCDHEMVSLLTTGFLQYSDLSGSRTTTERVKGDRDLEHAARFYGEALKQDPLLVEARLRLGHVQARRSQLAAAATHLEAVRVMTNHRPLKYLADVFLGLIESTRGRAARAAELYSEAMRIYPSGQTAWLAMSELAYLDGRLSEAAATITEMLTRDQKDDPWWQYLAGEWWHFDDRLIALRKKVQR